MNPKTYDRLPPDLKAVIDHNSGPELSAQAGRLWEQQKAPARKLAQERGNTVIVVPAAELANWQRAAQPVLVEWVADMARRQIDGDRLLADARALLTRSAASTAAASARDRATQVAMRRALGATAIAFALVGGVIVVLVAGVTVLSVLGRWMSATPIPGDVELVQLGTASALALFLPYCQLHGSHLIVDIFTARSGATLHRRLDDAARLAAAVVLALLAVRAAAGVVSLRAATETSMVLGVPLWLAYAPMVPSLALAALIALLGIRTAETRGAA